MSDKKCALIMAGGTGGHIFPALAVAEALKSRGWRVHWIGSPNGMEKKLVPADVFPFEPVQFQGIRGKGFLRWLKLPFLLLRASWQSFRVIHRVKPDIVLGFGGYISFPAGLMAWINSIPLIIHEQNSVPGMANRFLSKLAKCVFTTFPSTLKKGVWVGNPLRDAFLKQASPQKRFSERSGPLHIVVVGGSLGAAKLNELVPQALALIPANQRPTVVHQSGQAQLTQLESYYKAARIEATLLPFIDNTAQAFSDADLVLCRSGASTVSELAAIGVAAIFIPFPFAVDDHQTSNARYLSDKNAAWLIAQPDLDAKKLAAFLLSLNRSILLEKASCAKQLAKIDATQQIIKACEEIAS